MLTRLARRQTPLLIRGGGIATRPNPVVRHLNSSSSSGIPHHSSKKKIAAGFALAGSLTFFAYDSPARLLSSSSSPDTRNSEEIDHNIESTIAAIERAATTSSPPSETDESSSDSSDNTTTTTAQSTDAVPAFYITTSDESPVKLFTGSSHPNLANEVAMRLGTQLGRIKTSRFADGEVNIQVLDNVRGKNTFIIQSLTPPINESLIELILMITTLRRASAGQIVVVIPYMGYTRYARQEVAPSDGTSLSSTSGKREKERYVVPAGVEEARPVAAAAIAKMLTVAGVDHVVMMDVHHSQVTGFFGRTPVDDLDVTGIAATHFARKSLKSPVVVAPDHDGVQRAKRFRDLLIRNGVKDVSLAVVVDQRKQRLVTATETEFEESFDLVGDVEGKDCIIRDDIIESGFRVMHAAERLKRAGAARVFAFVTHALLTDDGYKRVEESPLVELVCSNSVSLKNNASDRIHQLSVAALLAETIKRIQNNESVSELFLKR